MIRRSIGLLGAALLIGVVAPASATAADPDGATLVNPATIRQPTAFIEAASPAGVLFEERSADMPHRQWFQPAGTGPAREIKLDYSALEGNFLFGRTDGGDVRWQDVRTGQEQLCESPGWTRHYTSTGWVSSTYDQNTQRSTYWRTTVTGGECTDRLIGTMPSGEPVAANADGFALVGPSGLSWFAGDDLGSPTVIAPGAVSRPTVAVEGSVLAWTDSDNGTHRLHRRSVNGGAAVTTEIVDARVPVFLTATHSAYVKDGTLHVVPAAGGAETTRSVGSGGQASDGTWIYFTNSTRTAVQRVNSAGDQPETVLTVPLRPATSEDLGLGPGRVATTNNNAENTVPKVVRRTFTQGTPPVVGTAGAELGEANEWNEFVRPIGTSIEQDGRRTAWLGWDAWIYLATEGGSTVRIPFPESRTEGRPWGEGMSLSGSRLLWSSYHFSPGDNPPPPEGRNAYLYDVRTGANTLLGATTGSDYALWGNYLVHALPNGSITRKDLSTGTVVTVKGPGQTVRGIDAHGSWVAWATCTDAECKTTEVSHRNLNGGTQPASVPTTGTSTVRLTNNFLYYDVGWTFWGSKVGVRRLTVGTTAPVDPGLVNVRDFEAHDETLGWIGGPDDVARIAPQPAFSARPRFLGGALGAAGFTPNGDGNADTWPVEFPLSKPLPTCAVTIRLNTTVVRTLNCANTNGAAYVTWNGRNTAGALVAKGRYTWTLTGSDTDGALLLWNGSATNYTGTVTVS